MTHPTEDDDFDPTPYIVPLSEDHPNPYEAPDFIGDDGKQDRFDGDERAEGLGGDAAPDAPLTVLEGRKRLRELIESATTHDWDGEIIKGYCLRVQRKAQQVPPLHTDAQQDYDDSTDKHPCTLATVDWSKVPIGARLYYTSAPGGSGHGHITDYIGVHNGKALTITTDVPAGRVGVVEPQWFAQHWGMPLEGWSGVVNGYNVLVAKDKDPGGGGQQQGGGHGWPGATEARVAVGILHNQVLPALAKVQEIAKEHDKSPVWDKAAADLATVARTIHTIHGDLLKVTEPEGK